MIVDYIGKMSSGDDKMRYELGHAIVGLEALAQEFNLCVVTAQQLNRLGTQAEIADLTHIAEAAALTHTAETILIYAQNKDERLHKLARLQIAKNFGTTSMGSQSPSPRTTNADSSLSTVARATTSTKHCATVWGRKRKPATTPNRAPRIG